MQEREFQNMFMFAKGFEAASLKWHCKDQQEDQDFYSILNSLSKKQMVNTDKHYIPDVDLYANFGLRLVLLDSALDKKPKMLPWK